MRPSPLNRIQIPRERRGRKSVLGALLLSVLLHLPLFFGLPVWFDNDEALEPTSFDAQREFELTVVEEERREKEKIEEERRGQFVSLQAPDEEERPDEARFRDQYDSQVEEEMARREPGRRPEPGPSSPQKPTEVASAAQPQQPARPTDPSPPRPRQSEAQPEPERERTETESSESEPSESEPTREEAPEETSESVDLEEPEVAEEGVVQESEQQEQKEGEKQAVADPSKLFPSMENTPASAVSGGGSMDYLRDVKEGDKNLLNRKRSRFWSFMNRVKENVAQQWSPGEEYRRRDPRGKVYGVKDRLTQLRVTLNGDGSLRTVYVARASGLDFYDEEAVRAFREASPFPNPPEGLKDSDGLIHFNFAFYLDVHSGRMRGIRIFR